MKSSIIDVPRKPSQADLFGIQVYQDALIKYIRLTDTPITIALQGEWGSGKTSLMNQLRYNLCDQEGAPYFAVWINTWQFSLMKTPQQAIISILEGIINQIGQLNPNKHKWEESKRKIGGVFKKMATIGTKVAAGVVGVEGDVVDDLFSPDARESDIAQLKEEIARLIEDALAHDASKQGFTFYIDDLDRIDPPVAVEILELLKNIFDLERCVFILAIDYDVVEEPDFKNWNDRIASRLKLRPLTEVEKASLDSVEEFDEEWEKVLFRMCQKETYLSTRTFSVSGLLNKIAGLVGNDAELGSAIAATLELSAVTNLKAFDGPLKKTFKFNRDTNSYRYNGRVYAKKIDLVRDVVADYVHAHPDLTHEQLKAAFPIKKNMDVIFMDFERYQAIKAEKGKVEFFGNRTMDDTIRLADKNILICSNWPTTSQGKPAEFSKFIDVARARHGIRIEPCQG